MEAGGIELDERLIGADLDTRGRERQLAGLRRTRVQVQRQPLRSQFQLVRNRRQVLQVVRMSGRSAEHERGDDEDPHDERTILHLIFYIPPPG